MAIPRIQQEDEEVLRDSLPYHWLKGLAQNEEEEEREPTPIIPLLFTAAFFGFMIFAITKRPFKRV